MSLEAEPDPSHQPTTFAASPWIDKTWDHLIVPIPARSCTSCNSKPITGLRIKQISHPKF